MSPEVLRAVVTILFGALAGGLTNTVAVWMLFHPYKPARLGPIRLAFLHGAIPKNRDRLARAVGQAVGQGLLTREDLTTILSGDEFRSAFEDRFGLVVQQLLEREWGPVRDWLPPESAREARVLLDEAASGLTARLETWLDTPEFEGFVERRIDLVWKAFSDRPMGELVTAARRRAFAIWLERWFVDVVEREATRHAVDAYLDQMMDRWSREQRTFREILPEDLVGFMTESLTKALPLIVRALGDVLEDPESRNRLEAALRKLFDQVLQDLRFHQRIVARLVVTEETLDQIMTVLRREGVEYVLEVLSDPTVQDEVGRTVQAGFLAALDHPVAEGLERIGLERMDRLRQLLGSWILAVARHPDTRSFLREHLDHGLDLASEQVWGDLLSRISPDQFAQLLIAVARSESGRRIYREAFTGMLQNILDRPFGRPADWLPDQAADRIQGALSAPLWEWLQGEVPRLVQRLDVARRVESKVRDYPTWQMEELVREVTDRELRLIVRLGYVLGAMIGSTLVAVNHFLT